MSTEKTPELNPQRTCIACRRKDRQGAFFRVSLDEERGVWHWNGRGRSAYICRTPECIDGASKKGRLERALKSQVNQAAREALGEELICKLR